MTDNKETFLPLVSTFVNEQVPSFVRQNHPQFVEYLKTFYEFLEQPLEPVGRIVSLSDITDVDFTTDEFFTLFKSTYLAPFPEEFEADRAMVVKRVKDLYAAKGTIPSIRLLFRILYCEEIEIFLPKTKILRASDGKWQADIRLFAELVSGDITEFGQHSFIGKESGAIANVNFVKSNTIGSFEVIEMFLLSFEGTFIPGELICDQETGLLTAIIFGVVRDVRVDDGGDDYIVGNVVNISHANGINATAEVSKIDSTNPVNGFTINDGGDGYRVGDPIDFSGSGGVGAVAKVDAISITTSIEQSQKLISSEQTTVLTSVAAIVIKDFLDFEFIDRGVITSVELLESGNFYPGQPFAVDVGSQPPAPCFGWDGGEDADIDATTANTGTILDIEVTNHGIGYTDTATADIPDGNALALGTPLVDGGPIVDGGFYTNTDGHLSSDMRLQDNVFWQNYSYEISSKRSINEWRDTVKAITHPAGYALFGKLCILEDIVNPFTIHPIAIDKCIVTLTDVSGAVIQHVDQMEICNWGGLVPCHVYDPFVPIIAEYQAELLDDWKDVPIIDLVRVDSDPCLQQNITIYAIDHP